MAPVSMAEPKVEPKAPVHKIKAILGETSPLPILRTPSGPTELAPTTTAPTIRPTPFLRPSSDMKVALASNTLTSLSCDSCAKTLHSPADAAHVQCPYCKSRTALSTEGHGCIVGGKSMELRKWKYELACGR